MIYEITGMISIIFNAMSSYESRPEFKNYFNVSTGHCHKGKHLSGIFSNLF
jgi:hypothetical protein